MRFLLVGDETAIAAGLKNHPNLNAHSEIVHAPDVVGPSEKPSQALRRAKTTSMGIAIDLVKQGRAGAAVSVGQYRRADGDGEAVAAHDAGDRPPRARRDCCRRSAPTTWWCSISAPTPNAMRATSSSSR